MSDTTWTAEEFDVEIEHFKRSAGEIFMRDGNVAPITFLFASYNPRDNRDEKLVIPVAAASMRDGYEKDQYSFALRTLASASRAVGVIFITEAWTLSCENVSGDVETEYEKWRGRLDQHPDRQEVIHLSAEHVRTGQRLLSARIVREGAKVTLEPWITLPVGKTSGRFTHLLQSCS